jgi:secreted trypsin-like serine protease
MEGAKGRVFGGEEATPYEFPWLVKFSIDKGEGFRGPCGGALISDRVILTATHCMVHNLQVLFGRLGYNVQEVEPVVKYKVALHAHRVENDSMEIVFEQPRMNIIHPGYMDGERRMRGSSENDIALVILDKPLNFSQARDGNGKPLYSPICLPKWGQRIPVEGMDAILAGWGGMLDSKGEGTVGDRLQKLTFSLQPLSVCNEPLKGVKRTFNTVICGGVGPKAPGPGDSGGPIVVETGPGKYTQVGAVGYSQFIFGPGGISSGNSTQITFYQDLQELLPWVDFHSNRFGAKYCKN